MRTAPSRPEQACLRSHQAGAPSRAPRQDLTLVATQSSPALGDLNGAVALQVLDRLPQSLIIAGGHGKVIWANRPGKALLQTRDGLLVDQAGTLRCPLPGPTTALLVLLGRAARGSGGEAHIARPPPGPPLIVLASPLPGGPALHPTGLGPADGEPKALLEVVDPERAAPPETGPAVERRLRMLYELTPAEAAVATHLGAGVGMQAVADALGVSVATARTHAKRVFDKTGIRRQSGLARLIERLAAHG